jgi:hypothetical protein
MGKGQSYCNGCVQTVVESNPNWVEYHLSLEERYFINRRLSDNNNQPYVKLKHVNLRLSHNNLRLN